MNSQGLPCWSRQLNPISRHWYWVEHKPGLFVLLNVDSVLRLLEAYKVADYTFFSWIMGHSKNMPQRPRKTYYESKFCFRMVYRKSLWKVTFDGLCTSCWIYRNYLKSYKGWHMVTKWSGPDQTHRHSQTTIIHSRWDTHTHMCFMGTVALMETITAMIVIYCTMIYCMHLWCISNYRYHGLWGSPS